MPSSDDEVIRIGTSVDISGLRDGLAQATQVNKAALDKLRADYGAATAAVQAATVNLSSAQAQLGAVSQTASEQGAQAAAILATYESELQKATEAEAQSAAALQALNAALMEEVAAAGEATVAQNAHAASLRGVMSETTEARYAAQLLGRELGVAMPRAISSVIAQSEQLGPIFAAAFPVAIGGYMGIELGKLIVKSVDLYDKWINLSEAGSAFSETFDKSAIDMQRHLDATNRSTEEFIRLTKSASAADAFKISIAGDQPVDLSKLIDPKKLEAMSQGAQDSIKKAFSASTFKDAGDRVADIANQIQHLKDLTADFNPMGGRTKQDLQLETSNLETAVLEWKAISDRYDSEDKALRAKRTADQKEEAERAARAVAEALRKQAEAQRKSDEDAMTSLELRAAKERTIGAALVQLKIQLVAQQIAADMAYPDLESKLNQQLAQLSGEVAAEEARASEKRIRVAQEYNNKVKRALEEKYALVLAAAELDAKVREALEKQAQDASRSAINVDSDQTVGGLQMQKLQVQRTASLTSSGPSDMSGKIAELQQMAAIDDKIIQEEIRKVQTLRVVDATANDTKKIEADDKQLTDLHLKQAEVRYAADTKILQLQQQRWKQYFDTIGNGFQNAVNQWIKTGQGFGVAMQNVGAELVTQLADHFIQVGLKWAETEAQSLAATIAKNTAKAGNTIATNQVILYDELGTLTTAGAAEEAQAGVSRLTHAKGAAQGTYDVVSAWPVVGPILAPAAAATAFAAVLAFEGGGIVPNARTAAILHPREMVLPQNISTFIQGAAANASGQGGGGTANVTTHITNQGLTDATFQAMASKHSAHITRTVLKGLRQANMI